MRPAVGRSVVSRKLKLDGTIREHPAVVVRSGPEGEWLYSPEGTPVTGNDQVVTTQPADGVQFFPTQPLPSSGGWYVAWCWAAAPQPRSEHWLRPWISVDIAEPGPTSLSFTDLELDLWCSATDAGVVDQDELAAAVAAGQLTTDTAQRATAAADELWRTLRHGCRDAFDGIGWSLLDHQPQQS